MRRSRSRWSVGPLWVCLSRRLSRGVGNPKRKGGEQAREHGSTSLTVGPVGVIAMVGLLFLGAITDATPSRRPQRSDCAERVFRKVRYRAASRHNVLDLYLPKGAAEEPPALIVWLHAGGWAGGSRASVRLWALRQVCRGYAVAAVDYRLSEEAVFPAQVRDVRAAIRFLRLNQTAYHIDTSRIVVWGASAGGHLASLLGTTAGGEEFASPGEDPDISSRVSAVIDWWGPTDFTRMDLQFPAVCKRTKCHTCPGSAESRLLGCAVRACPERARRASPQSYASADDAPMLIQHGAHDCTVPYRQGLLLHDALDAVGVPVEFQLVPRARHGDGRWSAPEVMSAVDAFLDLHLTSRDPTTQRDVELPTGAPSRLAPRVR